LEHKIWNHSQPPPAYLKLSIIRIFSFSCFYYIVNQNITRKGNKINPTSNNQQLFQPSNAQHRRAHFACVTSPVIQRKFNAYKAEFYVLTRLHITLSCFRQKSTTQ
jgi:hypothetical protein